MDEVSNEWSEYNEVLARIYRQIKKEMPNAQNHYNPQSGMWSDENEYLIYYMIDISVETGTEIENLIEKIIQDIKDNT
jgi:uncharacterized protein YdhG (YjbR/CyaY superfamily)